MLLKQTLGSSVSQAQGVRRDRIKTMTTKAIFRVVAAAVTFGAVAATPVSNAVAGGDFSTTVAQILMAQQDGPVSRLDDGTKQELIACVNSVLAGLPNGKKRFVVEAASFDEQQDRFGAVVMENRAEWKQKIARGCAHIVV
jgi:hypothetical protein